MAGEMEWVVWLAEAEDLEAQAAAIRQRIQRQQEKCPHDKVPKRDPLAGDTDYCDLCPDCGRHFYCYSWPGLRFIALEDAARGEPVRVEIDPPPPGVEGAQEVVEAAARAIVAEAAKQRKAGLLLDRLAAALALLDRERATFGR